MISRQNQLFRLAALCFVFMLALARIRQVFAADITLTTCNDSELRTAITTANDSAGADTLNLLAGCIYLLTDFLPTITTELTINGNGAVIDGNNSRNIFDVDTGASLIISAMTLQNGSATNGGAIAIRGSATV